VCVFSSNLYQSIYLQLYLQRHEQSMSALAGLGGNRRPLTSGTGGDHGELRSRPSGIGGNPTAEDLAKAKEIVSHDETILGVYRIAEGRDVDIAVLRQCEICVPVIAIYPCCPLSPCVLATYLAQRNWYRATLWIVTTTHIHRRAEPTDSVAISFLRNVGWNGLMRRLRLQADQWAPSTNASAPLYTVRDVTDELPCQSPCQCFCFKPSAAVLHLPDNSPLAVHTAHNGNERRQPHLALIYTADPVDLIALIRRAQDGQPAKDLAASLPHHALLENFMPGFANMCGAMNMCGAAQLSMPMPVVAAAPCLPVVAVEPLQMERSDDPLERIGVLKKLLDTGAIDQALIRPSSTPRSPSSWAGSEHVCAKDRTALQCAA
jgi:hypothetical protein